MKDTNRTPTTTPPRMISLEFESRLVDGTTMRATVHGAACEREDLIADGIDAILAGRQRMRRISAPFATPTPIVPATNPAYATACTNPDPTERTA